MLIHPSTKREKQASVKFQTVNVNVKWTVILPVKIENKT